MSGNICCVSNCRKSRRDFPTLKQYRFPKDEKLSQEWVIRTGMYALII